MPKLYNTMQNVGRAKYLANGTSAHNDGSPFYDVCIFKNKIKRDLFIKELEAEGYKYK